MPRLSIPLAVASSLSLSLTVQAMSPKQPDSSHLLRAIDRLTSNARVLYVAAHPDDENTRLLSWLVDHAHVRAAYLSLTRGEGGQNLLGSEQSPLLGVIRTQELLAARGIDGAEQFFGRERDFGYSKTAEETLSIWGKEQALGDVVWAIRRFEPDVIVTRFSPEDRETHGHHTASAILALEAFSAAADPKAYPEQLKYFPIWKARRIVWNKGVFGPPKPGALDGFLPLDIGGFDPVIGASSGEIAALSRSMHKSQGFGSSPQRGAALEYFKVLAGEPMQKSFLDGVDLTWASVPGAEKLRDAAARVRSQFALEHPSASIPALLNALNALDALPDAPWKASKRDEFANAIAACAGLHLEANVADASALPGRDEKVTVVAINRSDAVIVLHSVRLPGGEVMIDKPLENNLPVTMDHVARLPDDAPLTNPYWLDDDPSTGLWTVRDQTLVGLPEQPSAIFADFLATVSGKTLTFRRPLTFVWNDPVAGERVRLMEVLPPVTVNIAEPVLMFPDAAPKDIHVTVRASRGAVSGTLKPTTPAGFSVTPAAVPFKLSEGGTEETIAFQVKPPVHLDSETASASGTIRFAAELEGGGAVGCGVRRIEYPHIPIQTTLPLAETRLVRFGLKRAVTRLGYIPGAGDEVPAALQQAGYEVTMLSDEALAKAKLESFQAIVVGVRAFNTNDKLPRFHDKLMKYVQNGGTLLVQYNTQNRISKIVGQVGPWPFNISQDRVTEERAAVDLLDPRDPFFNTPNKLAAADFDGWVQERGLYFADTWDEKYRPLLSMHDANEPERKGSLLVGKYGKGLFIYTGLSFFRQLPAGVPGAFRLFANLLTHGR